MFRFSCKGFGLHQTLKKKIYIYIPLAENNSFIYLYKEFYSPETPFWQPCSAENWCCVPILLLVSQISFLAGLPIKISSALLLRVDTCNLKPTSRVQGKSYREVLRLSGTSFLIKHSANWPEFSWNRVRVKYFQQIFPNWLPVKACTKIFLSSS